MMLDFILGVVLVLVGFCILRFVFDVLRFYYLRSISIKEERYRESGGFMNPKTGRLTAQKRPDV